jgi:hypothetical protein
MTPITQPAAAMPARQASASDHTHHTPISRDALTTNHKHKHRMAKSDQQLTQAAGGRRRGRAMLSEA